jgi:tryptophanase
MNNIILSHNQNLPIEMHKVRIVQKLQLLEINNRLTAIQKAGFNTFLLKNEEVFLDMLTDSGTNAMSDQQLAAMMQADDSYAGSATYYRLEKAVNTFFGTHYFLPTHQGRACENIIAHTYVKPGSIIPMNYHFTTTKAHIVAHGGQVEELFMDEALQTTSNHPFKGNIDMQKLDSFIEKVGISNIPFLRIEMGTNLIGGQPISLENIQTVSSYCRQKGIMIVIDASLISDNLYFMKIREEQCKSMSLHEITLAIAKCADIIYFSARKLGSARGGGICMFEEKYYKEMRDLIPLFEGFITYGGMSTREMEALATGLEESLDLDMINQ